MEKLNPVDFRGGAEDAADGEPDGGGGGGGGGGPYVRGRERRGGEQREQLRRCPLEWRRW